jgi:hypothetical protein
MAVIGLLESEVVISSAAGVMLFYIASTMPTELRL